MAKKRQKASRRTKRLQVRLSAADYAHVERCAAVRSVTVSEYARLVLVLGRLT
jgi:hypothetical protein